MIAYQVSSEIYGGFFYQGITLTGHLQFQRFEINHIAIRENLLN